MRSRIAALVACAVAAAAVAAGCGGGGGSSNVDVGTAAAVPPNAPIYLDGVVKPQGSAQQDATAALQKILHTNDPGAQVISLVDQAGQNQPKGQQFSYQSDIAPWLGEHIGAFLTSLGQNSNGAAVVETTNAQAALAFARKASGATATNPAPQPYNGSSYQTEPDSPDQAFGLVGNFLVQGTVTAFKAAVDASKGDSLGDSSDFKDAIDNLPDNRLGTFYTVPKTLLAAIPPGQINPGSQALFERAAGDNLENPVAGALTASADSLDLEFQGKTSGEVNTPESSLLGDVPGDAWLALGIGDVGHAARQLLDQLKSSGLPNLDQTLSQVEAATGSSVDELTGALGDAVIYVKGTSKKALSGALVVQVTNPELIGRLLGQLQTLLSFSGGVKPLTVPGGGTGFQFSDPTQAPQPVEIAQQGDKLVVGYGPGSAREALQPSQSLSSSPSFTTAKDQVSSLGADLFLSFPPILQLVKSSGSAKNPGFQQAKPYLNALNYLVSGSGSQDGNAVLKAVLGLR